MFSPAPQKQGQGSETAQPASPNPVQIPLHLDLLKDFRISIDGDGSPELENGGDKGDLLRAGLLLALTADPSSRQLFADKGGSNRLVAFVCTDVEKTLAAVNPNYKPDGKSLPLATVEAKGKKGELYHVVLIDKNEISDLASATRLMSYVLKYDQQIGSKAQEVTPQEEKDFEAAASSASVEALRKTRSTIENLYQKAKKGTPEAEGIMADALLFHEEYEMQRMKLEAPGKPQSNELPKMQIKAGAGVELAHGDRMLSRAEYSIDQVFQYNPGLKPAAQDHVELMVSRSLAADVALKSIELGASGTFNIKGNEEALTLSTMIDGVPHHYIFINENALSSFPRAMKTLDHEFNHIKLNDAMFKAGQKPPSTELQREEPVYLQTVKDLKAIGDKWERDPAMPTAVKDALDAQIKDQEQALKNLRNHAGK